MRKCKTRSFCAILATFAMLVGLLSISFIPATAGADDTPIEVLSIKEGDGDGPQYSLITLTLDTTTDYFGGTKGFYDSFYPSVWGDYASSPMRNSLLKYVSIEIDGVCKAIGDWGGGVNNFYDVVAQNAEGKWELRFMSSKTGGHWTDPATQKIVVSIHPGFVTHDGTHVTPVTYTREAGPALGSGEWVKSTCTAAPPTTVVDLGAADFVNYAGAGYRCTMRLVLAATYTAEMAEISGEFQTVHNPDSGIASPAITKAVSDGVNDCILINGKTVREINAANNMPNAVEIRLGSWPIDPAKPNQYFWIMISNADTITKVTSTSNFTVQTLPGLVEFYGGAVLPIAKRWNGTAFVDYDPTQTAAALAAASITSVTAPVNGDTAIAMPTVPDGCTISIQSSSNTAAIALDGTITQQAEPALVKLVFRVRDGDGNVADTKSISVTVPRAAAQLTAAQEAADAITSLRKISYSAAKLPMPAVPEGCTVAIKSSSDTAAIALDGTITKGEEVKDVELMLTVTDGDGNTADTIPLTVSVPKQLAVSSMDYVEVQAPDFKSYTSIGYICGIRLIVESRWNDAMLEESIRAGVKAEFQTVHNPNSGIASPDMLDEVAAGVNDSIFINGKSVREINAADGINAIEVRLGMWAVDPSSPYQDYWLLINNAAVSAEVSADKDFTISSKAGLVDWQGVPITPMSKKWSASKGVFMDYYTAQEAAAMTTSLDNPGIGISSMMLPTVGGCTAVIKSSSNTDVIKLDGSIAMPDAETEVTLVLTFTDDQGGTADTAPITVKVPKKGEIPVVDVSFLTEYVESNFPMMIFQFDTSNDYGIDNIYNGLQYFENYDLVWLNPINKPAFRNSVANLLKISVGDGEAKTISEWGTAWHLAFYVQDGKWIMRFHYTGTDDVKNWPDKTVTVEFLEGFAFPDGTKVNPMKFERKAAAIGEGKVNIIAGFPTAAGMAASLNSDSIPSLEQDQTKLPIPTLPDGYSIKLTYSSKENIIGLDGKITPPSKATFVTLRFTITRLSDGTTAETDGISVMVPKGSGKVVDSSSDSSTPDSSESTPPDDDVKTGDSLVAVAVCTLLAGMAAAGVVLSKKRRQA